jgi:cerevisin
MVLYVAWLSLMSHTKSHAQIRGADVQTNAPWNLQAISTRVPVNGPVNARTYTYTYNQPAGGGVDIYILDSGVYIEHSEFQGRASLPWAAPPLTTVDGFGHGTNMAGIAAGRTYGVAKQANIIGVRILDNTNYGSNAQGIEGINWIADNVRVTGRPSIACMAFNGVHNGGVNLATTLLVADGVTVVTAAGNNAQSASGSTPAGAVGVIVVGASDITNTMAPTSNFGPLVGIFAPGVYITGPWNTGPNDYVTASGTSQACAHVSGLAAYLLAEDPTLEPGPLFSRILDLATPNAIRGVPAGTTTDFVYNGIVP